MNFARRIATHPQFAGQVRIDTTRLPDNPDAATDLTVRRMVELAFIDARSHQVGQAVFEALYDRAIHTTLDVCRAVHEWVRENVEFVRDSVPSAGANLPADTEVIIRPVDILAMTAPQGDCDCMQTLAGSMMLAARRLLSMKFEPRFIAVAASSERRQEFSHVYLCVFDGFLTRIPVDVSHGPVVGWETPNRFGKRRAWSLDGVSLLTRLQCSLA